MRTICLIVYDLKSDDDRSADYYDLYKEIDSLGHSLRIQKSAWLIETGFTVKQLYSKISCWVDTDRDKLLVTEINNEYYGEGSEWVYNRIEAKKAGTFCFPDGTWFPLPKKI